MTELSVTEIWQRYQKGIDYLNRIDHINKTQRCHRFYTGDQWYGIKSGGEELPSLNFIKGIIRYKVTTIAQNNVTAVFSPMESDSGSEKEICRLLGRYFRKNWEQGKLDILCRKLIKDAAIQGDSYIYFGEGAQVKGAQLIDNVNIFLSDEQNSEIQEQKYIIIRERRFVEDVKKEARENGIDEWDIDSITSDTDTYTQLGDRVEVNLEEKGKCISLLYMEKDDEGYVHISRSVKNIVYQPDTILKCSFGEEKHSRGLKSYPVVNFLWDDKKGSARGCGEVEYLISNQIEINKTIARRSIAIKQTAFPMLAYAANLINNPDELDVIGGKISVNNGNAQSIEQIVSFLKPAHISPDAKVLSDELLFLSRELAGASDSVIGNIDPTKASGTAIIAVRDQALLPLNEQVARFSRLVEDLARLFIDMWVAYNPLGIRVESEAGYEMISVDLLEKMKINIFVDVMKASAFDLYATEQSLLEFYGRNAISFEEFVEALPEGGAIPKNRLCEIIEKRKKSETKGFEPMEMAGGGFSGSDMDYESGFSLENEKESVLKELLTKRKELKEIIEGGKENEMQHV